MTSELRVQICIASAREADVSLQATSNTHQDRILYGPPFLVQFEIHS